MHRLFSGVQQIELIKNDASSYCILSKDNKPLGQCREREGLLMIEYENDMVLPLTAKFIHKEVLRIIKAIKGTTGIIICRGFHWYMEKIDDNLYGLSVDCRQNTMESWCDLMSQKEIEKVNEWMSNQRERTIPSSEDLFWQSEMRNEFGDGCYGLKWERLVYQFNESLYLEVHNFLYELINTGHYCDVQFKWRMFYGSLLCLYGKWQFEVMEDYEAALKCVDEGLLLGYDGEAGWLAKFGEELVFYQEELGELNVSEKIKKIPGGLENGIEIETIDSGEIETFITNYRDKCKPVIIKDVVNHWPAFKKWTLEYLYKKIGHRRVPIEIGSKYTDDSWYQRIMPFKEFISTGMKGYLAQHRLLEQIPSLKDDIIVPDFAYMTNEISQLEMNVFIGPAGTLSPLHCDPRNNLFCQIKGRKFVRLVSPNYNHEDELYLFGDMIRNNSSAVDVLCPDYKTHPGFRNVVVEDYVMEAGDCLYIPKKYFHCVYSLESSVSVSVWFD